jgi:hypothetical protein
LSGGIFWGHGLKRPLTNAASSHFILGESGFATGRRISERKSPADALALDNVAKRVEIASLIPRSTLGDGFVDRRCRLGCAGPVAGRAGRLAGGDGHGRPSTPKGENVAHFASGGAGPAGTVGSAGGVSMRGSDSAAADRAGASPARSVRRISPIQVNAAFSGGSVSHDAV